MIRVALQGTPTAPALQRVARFSAKRTAIRRLRENRQQGRSGRAPGTEANNTPKQEEQAEHWSC